MRATAFTAPGSGATLGELREALLMTGVPTSARGAFENVIRLAEMEGESVRTNLVLLSQRLTDEDLVRIEQRCEVKGAA